MKNLKFLPLIIFMLFTAAACTGRGMQEYEEYTPAEEPALINQIEEPATEPCEKPSEEPVVQEPTENTEPVSGEQEELDARRQLWANLSQQERNNPDRILEMENRSISYGEVSMDFVYFIIGDKPANGRSLYIALHGGGGVPAEVNDQQFRHMQTYYRFSVTEGVYVAVRGVRDTWNTHFNPESFPIYDRLIENMILFHGVDPNRVYLLGFSAGGDGVYAITPRMADRFAAVSMSAGHHNWVNPINYKHTPIILQCGDSDFAFYRHIETVNIGEKLQNLGYTFTLNMHVGMSHNFSDNGPHAQQVWADPFAWRDGHESKIVEIDTNAIRFLEQHTRNPLPSTIAWHLGTRAYTRSVESFYWLRAAHSLDYGIIRASFDTAANAIAIKTEDVNGAFYVLLNRRMVDFDSPVTLSVNGNITEITVEGCWDILKETTLERMDPNFQFTAKLRVEA